MFVFDDYLTIFPSKRLAMRATNTQTLKEMDIIFTCYESRNFDFPKKYFTVNTPSPMMRLYNKKLVVVRNTLSTYTARRYFLLYLEVFYSSFLRLYSIYELASASNNRQMMVRKDLELLTLLGRNHVELFDQVCNSVELKKSFYQDEIA